MSYNFLTLVNDLAKRIGEVELSSANFAGALGIYGDMKNAINNVLNDINTDFTRWPFNYTSYDETLVIGQTRYPFQADTKVINIDSFRIQRNDSLSVTTTKLTPITYEQWMQHRADEEYSTDNYDVPKFVFKTPSLAYGVSPSPDKAYTLTYDYFMLPTELSVTTDVPTVPALFKTVILDGAVAYLHLFKGDVEGHQLMYQKYLKGLKDMKGVYINRYYEVTSSMIVRPYNELGINGYYNGY